MFGAILKATNSSFQKGMTYCRSIYVKKVMKLLSFIFEQPSYVKIVGILPFISRINATSETSRTRAIFIQFQSFSPYGELKFHAQLS